MSRVSDAPESRDAGTTACGGGRSHHLGHPPPPETPSSHPRPGVGLEGEGVLANSLSTEIGCAICLYPRTGRGDRDDPGPGSPRGIPSEPRARRSAPPIRSRGRAPGVS
jgi:hypothetical protein